MELEDTTHEQLQSDAEINDTNADKEIEGGSDSKLIQQLGAAL